MVKHFSHALNFFVVGFLSRFVSLIQVATESLMKHLELKHVEEEHWK